MFRSIPRRRAIALAIGLSAVGAGITSYVWIHRRVAHAWEGPLGASAPLQFTPLAQPAFIPQHWGSAEVEGVVRTAEGPVWVGGFGVRDLRGNAGLGLPTLKVSAAVAWRGHLLVALASGGLFLRREGQWEELRSGYGTLHVRALVESAGGELWIGAREGLFRAAFGATTLDRLDRAPVKCLALGGDGTLYAGGEAGLQRVRGQRIEAVPTPDPWIEWVDVQGRELRLLTPLGLARGPVEGALAPIPGGEDATAAAAHGAQIFTVSQGRLLRFEPTGRATEEHLVAPARRVFTVEGELFVDTGQGLFRRGASGWALVQPLAEMLPAGSGHVNALGMLGSQVVMGVFNGGLVAGELPPQASRNPVVWRAVPGTGAWGVNALHAGGGSLYVASLRGASRFDGQRLWPLEGGEGGAAFSLASNSGGLVVGFGQGVALPGGRFVSAFHGLPGNQALALAQGEQLFVGTPTGLGAVAGSRVAWRVTAGEGRLPHPWITALHLKGEALYIGTYGGGVARRTPAPADPQGAGRFEPFPETEGLKVNTGCLVEADGRIYLGTDGRGLWRLDAQGARFLPVRLPLPSPRITAILPLPGGLLVGTDEGLARLNLPLPEEGD